MTGEFNEAEKPKTSLAKYSIKFNGFVVQDSGGRMVVKLNLK